MNIADIFDRQVDVDPARTAICDFVKGRRRETDYRAMQELSMQLAVGLQGAGLKKRGRVLVFQPMSLELYLCLLALFRIGCTVMFLDPSAGRKHIDRCCELLPPDAMIALPKAHLLRLVSKQLRKTPLFFSTGRWLPLTRKLPFADSGLVGNVVVEEDDPALITFTSGSTGLPKVAIRTHGFLLAQLDALSKSITFPAGDTVLETMPIFGLANLASGMTTLIPGVNLIAPGRIDPVPVVQQIEEGKPQRLVASPAFLDKLLSICGHDDPRLNSLENIFTGGGPVFPELMKKARLCCRNAKIVAVYGSTEAEPIAHISLEQIDEADFRKMASGGGLLTGAVEPEVELRIISDRWGTPLPEMTIDEFNAACVPTGEAGEIVVSGKHVLKGYYEGRGDEETKFRVSGEVWHRTGDCGTLDDMGRLWLLGRCNAVLASATGSLYPFAVETAAMQNPLVERAALCQYQSEIVLCLQLNNTAAKEDAVANMTESIREKIDRFVVLDKIPLDKRHNAKVDYTQLEAMIARNLFTMQKTTNSNIFVLFVFLLAMVLIVPPAARAECVILLHGLARSDGSMEKMKRHLEAKGYDVVNVDYSSTKHNIEFLAENVISSNLGECPADEEIHFVTHSLGGILVRQYLSEHEISGLGRVVMLGPPNKGSEVVDKLGNFPGFYFINGDAGMQLGTGEFSVPNRLGRANFDVGIIAGTRSINLILSMLIPEVDDGKVSVDRTKLEGMNDHIKLPVSHPFLMKDDEVIKQVIYYLEYGKFRHSEVDGAELSETINQVN